jgi:5'-3' exoribonuclease 2
MQIYLKSLYGKTIIINDCNTVQKIKNYILSTLRLPVHIQNITRNGKFLNNNDIVYDQETLQLTLPLKGGGIPTFFQNIITKFPDTYFSSDSIKADTLFIDFNSIIYTVIHILNQHKPNIVDFENMLIAGVIKHLKDIIITVKPKKYIYIGVDGVPPRAKMIQQRCRRYKYIKELNFKKDMEKKYNINIPETTWNRSAISPGTSFMAKLSKIITNNIQQGIFHEGSKFTIIYSDETNPGEGEHKIFNFMKELNKPNFTHVIYSPDADLIILSVVSGMKKIYILRESETGFKYLSVAMCKNEFYREMEGECEDILKDYTFLTFFCGNDFVKNVSFLKIKDDGLDLLISIYKEVYNCIKQPMVIDDKINYSFLLLFLKELKNYEVDKMKKWQKRRDQIRNGQRNKKRESYENTKPQWEVEYLRFQHEEYYSPLHPHHEKLNKVFDKINYFNKNWRKQYNDHFFPDENIDEVCGEYIKSLEFCFRYYFGNNIPPSWLWYYKYRAAPTMHDLYDYLETNMSTMGMTKFSEDGPVRPFEQLMMILPINSFKLLPKCLNVGGNEELNKYYPKKFMLDILQGTKFIYSEPVLPDIPLETIKQKIKINENNFTPLEIERNTLKNKPFIFTN